MNHTSIDDKRRLIPRWRSFHKTSMTGELSTSRKNYKPEYVKNDLFYDQYIQEWENNKTSEIAAEIVFHCLTIGKPELATQQAIYLKSEPNISSELDSLVNKILVTSENSSLIENDIAQLQYLKDQLYVEIHRFKKLLHEWPNSSLYWMELARLYSALGEKEKSHKAVKAALQLGGDNRYIIRSAIRFFVHIGDYDALTAVFTNYKQLYKDQWILSAFISLHDLLRRHNLKTKTAKQLITHLGDRRTTELSGALASLELDSGSIKASKKLFKSSIINPNDNSLAQLAWAEKYVGRLTKISEISVPFDYEAQTREWFRYDDPKKSLKECVQWMIDEPYSITPAITGSYIASSLTDDLKSAQQFCEIGLNANPSDPTLLNNNAFCQAKTGNIEGAIQSLNKINDIKKNSPLEITVSATTGLVNMRQGFIEKGREHYSHAIELAGKLNMTEYKAIASLYLAEEEIKVGQLSREKIEALINKNMPKERSSHLKQVYDKINIELSLEFQKRQILNSPSS